MITTNIGIEVIEKEAHREQPGYAGQSQLYQYVDACLRPSVLQGLEILRLQGGYINIPIATQTLTVKDFGGEQIRLIDGSQRAYINPYGDGNKVPYWITQQSLLVPSLDFMEEELEIYVTRELMKCVEDFKTFRDQKYDVNYGDIITDVEMEKAVVVNIDFPITMERDEIRLEEESFNYNVPINMKLIHDIASQLTLYESVFSYLETHTKSLISLYSGIDENKLPPFSMSLSNFDCDYVSWTRPEVEQRLKGIFGMNLANLKIEGTDFTLPQTNDPIAQGVYEGFVYDFFNEDFENVKVDYSYRPEWDFNQYDIKPSEGETLMPDRVNENKLPLIPMICAIEYNFKYTLDYPVLIQITDYDSAKIDPRTNTYIEKDDFTFQFVMNSWLCGNQKRECTGRKVSLTDYSSVLEETEIDLPERTYFCDQEQRISGEYTIKTVDSQTSEPITYMDVHYFCGSHQNNCFMGRTDSSGTLKTKFPYCLNGIIYFSKSDYATKQDSLTVNNDVDYTVTYEVSPLKEFDVDVKKVHIPTFVKNYHEGLSTGLAVMDFEPSEKATLSGRGPSSIAYLYPNTENSKVKIGEGNYDLNSVIYGDVIFVETDFGNEAIAESFEGTNILGSSNIGFDVVRQDLMKNKVTFYVLAEHKASELQGVSWEALDDPIIQEDGTMSAELLYQGEIVPSGLSFICSYDNQILLGIDGTYIDDFSNDDDNCHKVVYVTIPKEQYEILLKPQFS